MDMQLGSYVGGLKWLPLGLDFISGWVKDRFIIVGENVSLGLGGGFDVLEFAIFSFS